MITPEFLRLGVTEVWVKGEYWPAKWERLLSGLSAAELSIVAAVALTKREHLKEGRTKW